MIVRTLVTTLYFVSVVAALLLQFLYPELALYLIVGLLAWFVASLFVYRLPVMSRSLGAVVAPTPSPTPALGNDRAGAPLASAPASGPGATLDFCAYCAHPVEPGTPICPECQHRIPFY